MHEVVAECIEQELEPFGFVGRTLEYDGFDIEFTEDMAECMVDGIDWIREQPGKLFVEQRVFLDPYMPGESGTLDIGMFDCDTAIATIKDWKFGYNLVQVVGSYQLRAYGVGFYESILKPRGLRPKKFRFIIEQPRATGGCRYYTPWEVDFDEVMAFGEEMAAIKRAADDPNAPRIAGQKQCRFCDAKETGCAVYEQYMLDLCCAEFDDLDNGEVNLPEISILTPARRAFLVRHEDMVTSFFKRLKEDMLQAAIAGDPTPDLKAIDGPAGKRKYTDESAAKSLVEPVFGEESFTKKLKSPAQLEKMMKPGRKNPGHPELWERLQAVITRDPPKPVLVLASDPRPAVKPIADQFDDLP